MLKSQDIVLALKLVALDGAAWTYPTVAQSLGTPVSAVHQSFQRLVAASLADPLARRVSRAALHEFLVHGVRYVFPGVRGAQTRGMLTGSNAPVFAGRIAAHDQPLVWSTARGSAKGESLEPLHECVPKAAAADAKLYALLTVVDTLRTGTARERSVAATVLSELLAQKTKESPSNAAE